MYGHENINAWKSRGVEAGKGDTEWIVHKYLSVEQALRKSVEPILDGELASQLYLTRPLRRHSMYP